MVVVTVEASRICSEQIIRETKRDLSGHPKWLPIK